MKTKLASTIILTVLITIASTQLVLAQTVTVGVRSGDTFNYSYIINWDSTDPAATVPALYEELNTTQFIRITVVNVTGSLINLDFTRHFSNGTEQTQNGNVDVNSQILEIPYAVLIIRADANMGEKTYPAGGHSTLSDTETRTYPLGQIETIRYVSPETDGSDSVSTDIYFDRAKGVGLEYFSVSQETSGSVVATTKETLMITSWAIGHSQPSPSQNTATPTQSTPTPKQSTPSPVITTPTPQQNTPGSFIPILAAVIVAIVVVVIIAAVFLRKKTKQKRWADETQS